MRTGQEEGKSERGRPRQALVEHEAGEQNRHQDALLVDGHDRADGAVLQRLEVAEPAAASGQPGQHEGGKRPPVDVRARGLRSDGEHEQIGEEQHLCAYDGVWVKGVRSQNYVNNMNNMNDVTSENVMLRLVASDARECLVLDDVTGCSFVRAPSP